MNKIIRSINDELKMTVTSFDVDALATISEDDAIPENVSGMLDRMKQCDMRGSGSMKAWQGGVESLAQARALFAKGWKEGADRAESLRRSLDGLIPSGTIARRTRSFGDEGDEIRLDRALAGDWDRAWESRTISQQRDSNVISIATGWIASGATNHNDLLWNAIQLIVLSDALEEAGWRVELRAIDGTYTYSHHGYLQMFDVMMKRPEEPMRSDIIAATIGHGGVYRTLGFVAMWTCPKRQQESLGRCIGISESSKHEIGEAAAKAVGAGMMPSVSLVIPRADNETRARNNVRAAVAELFPQTAAV
jgi:hypothetical protein